MTPSERAGYPRPRMSRLGLNVIVASYVMIVLNTGFWHRLVNLFEGQPLVWGCFAAGTWMLTLLLLELFGPGPLQKPVAALLILVAAVAHYYESAFGVLIDDEMVRNVFETTVGESRHLITADAVLRIGLTGVLPAALVFWPRIARRPLWHQVWRWPAGIAVTASLTVAFVLTDYKAYSAALREHHDLMGSYQPGATLNAVMRFAQAQIPTVAIEAKPYGTDAHPGPYLDAAEKPVLLVLFVGETVRAQNFGLNGYDRNTTPELARRPVIAFTDVTACGTSTAVSVPCMFSPFNSEEYEHEAFLGSENLLDVLGHAGFDVKWWDNNTGDQRVAARTGWQTVDPTLDQAACAQGECTDALFLPLIRQQAAEITRNTVLVLHMIGSHGPAYYLRYPPEAAVYLPDCRTAAFSDCSNEQIVNTYDNTIRETDRVLSGALDILSEAEGVTPAMLYLSDHGESLGENGLYLHAAPSFMAPEQQTKVPMVMWLSPGFESALGLDGTCMAGLAGRPASHDNLFHTVLGLLDVETEVRRNPLDLTAGCRRAEGA